MTFFEDLSLIVPNTELVISAVLAIAFAVIYTSFFNWRKTAAGRAVFQLVLSLITVFTVNVIGVFVGAQFPPAGEYPGRWVVRTVAYSYMVFAFANLIATLVRNRYRGNPDESRLELKDRTGFDSK